VNDRLLTAADLADRLGFAAGTIVDWAEAGTIPAFKLGGRLRFRLSEVDAWLEERRLKRPGRKEEVLATPLRTPGPGRIVSLASNPDSQGGDDA
jgi:excisionase family DNA binding protein